MSRDSKNQATTRIRQQREFARRVQQEFNAFKLKKGCIRCRYKKCAAALDFHHVDPFIKERRVDAKQWKADSKLTRRELAKCILLCANCHREEHHKLGEK